jgi:hypothetical protein
MHSAFGNRKKKQKEFDKHELLHSYKVTALNPLDVFPSKSASVSHAFFGVDVPEHKKKIEANVRWLDTDTIDPEFGIKVKDIRHYL